MPRSAAEEPSNAELIARLKAQTAERVAAIEADNAAIGTSALPATQADLSIRPPDPKVVEPAAPAPAPAPTAAPGPRLSDAEFEAAVKAAEARLAESEAATQASRNASNRASGSGGASTALPSLPARRPPRAAPKAQEQGALSISKATRKAPVAPQLARGFQSFQSGDLRRARRAYNGVLREDPTNRDAWLGIAAIATTNGNSAQATAIYERLLARNPQDSVARAGLMGLKPAQDANASISGLKTLLADEPEAAHLHFSLGNAYAQQGRWPEAQNAYFSAFRFDNANADYAFNLAVSLDHLAQAAAARDYYQRALSLAGDRGAGFARAAARDRIVALSATN
ncbi:MAG: tetratricopeptide repeat protein [Pseudomonadota bacterium]